MTDDRSTATVGAAAVVEQMRALSVRALQRMYQADEGTFVFCVRRTADGNLGEGVSRRYTAIVLIGLATEPESVATSIFGGSSAGDVCGRLLADVDTVEDPGDVALTLWAAAVLGHGDATRALDRLRVLDPVRGSYPTVEIAWTLTALSANRKSVCDDGMARRVAGRLISSCHEASGAFSHWSPDARQVLLRSHVCCFADLVYPVQALSCYYSAIGDERAIETAKRGAAYMCERQGPAGQWWWHFDARTGRVVERYPVYAVHQDAMAPMALFALKDACGVDHSEAIERGLCWLTGSPELDGGTLIDEDADLIWRKVARHEPGKLSRGLQALASRAHPSLRVPGIGMVFRPGRVDYECRPYHLGWILHAWPRQRLEQWAEGRIDD